LYRGINAFKKGYQPRTNIVQDKKGDLVTDSHSILAKERNLFYQLFNVYGVSDVRQKEIYTAEPLVPEPSVFEVEIAIEKIKKTQITRYLLNPNRTDYNMLAHGVLLPTLVGPNSSHHQRVLGYDTQLPDHQT
jgi:hypothetical protein